MSSRGRGFSSRGGGGGNSYRGRGGGDWGGSSGNSRGGFSSSRGGRFNKYSGGGYESRSKYNNSGGSDRYSSRGGRGDHSNSYKRPRDQPYSGRDDHRSSSETSRKRARNDSYQGDGSSQRYSSGYPSSSYDNKRSTVYDDKRQNDRYHRNDERHQSASRSYPAPPPPRISDITPQNQRFSNRGRLPQANYRGRGSARARGSYRSRSDLLARKRNLTTTIDYRRKLLTSRSRDYVQRARIATKMRRSGAPRIAGKKEGGNMKDKDRELAKAINAEFSDEEEEKNQEENWEEEEEEEEKVQLDQEEDVKPKPKEDKRKKDKERRGNGEQEKEGVKGEDEEEEEEEEEEEVDVKPEIEEDEEMEEDTEEKTAEDGEGLRRDGKRFSKLRCPHCPHRCSTFKEYSLHLYSGRHNTAMRRIAARHKANIARMRVVQRQAQRRLEAKDEERGTLPSRTMFCQICKLNYRSLKSVHHLSESHRQMKRFLTPFCRTCRVPFRSPMLYETHVASLDHIKALLRKNSDDKKENGDGESSAPEEDDKEVNLDNFMTLDSVGDVDAEEEDESGEKKKKDTEESGQDANQKKAKTKQMIKVGAEYIKKVEVQFCDLCKVYLPRNENAERAVALHCSTRSHLKRYVRDNDDKALRREAERIHLQTSSSVKTGETGAPAEPSKDSPASDGTPKESSASAATEAVTAEDSQAPRNSTQTTEENADATESEKNPDNPVNEEEEEYPEGDCGDKLWDDVDKDLGDILREAEPGKSSDDEDSRYDRFRNTEKSKKDQENAEAGADDAKQKVDVKIKVEKAEK